MYYVFYMTERQSMLDGLNIQPLPVIFVLGFHGL